MSIKTLISTTLIALSALSTLSVNANAAYTVDGTVVKVDKQAMTISIKDNDTQQVTEYQNLPTSLIVKDKGESAYFKMASLKKGEQVKLTFRD